jgi:hypothetical protein
VEDHRVISDSSQPCRTDTLETLQPKFKLLEVLFTVSTDSVRYSFSHLESMVPSVILVPKVTRIWLFVSM